MSALARLSQQISVLNDTLRQTKLLIDRLSTLSFQPGSEPLDENTGGSARIELAQDIQDSLKQLDEDFELLHTDAEEFILDAGFTSRRKDSEREKEREKLEANVTRFAEELQQARTSFRSAQLNAKRASEAAKIQERELVFKSIIAIPQEETASTSGAEPLSAERGHRRQRTQPLSKDEILVNASSDVTTALRRTHELLSTELSRSRFAQETFDNSTEALKELGEKYSSLDNVLTNSRSLLGTLLRSQKSDTWYLETALYILIATLVWLIFRRLLFGPFVKLPLFVWKLFAFSAYWLVLKPLYLFLTITGIIRSEAVPAKFVPSFPTKSRAPLIIQPSASDFAQRIPESIMSQIKDSGVRAGAGGSGAKVGKEGILDGEESEKLGRMVEQAAQAAKAQAKEPVRRGDGTVLQDRGDIPKNPRKKAFDADADPGKPVANQRDEL